MGFSSALGQLVFPVLILIFITIAIVGVGAFVSIVGAKGVGEMAMDDWISLALVS